MTNHESVILLHLKLKKDWHDEREAYVLKKYGDVTEDLAITRTILAPADITLHGLHFAIQRLFGWQNSHLHCFKLADKDFKRLTDNQVYKWSNLVGLLFYGLIDDLQDRYWDDDYQSGNYKTWMRKKYTGPYHYGGYIEDCVTARESVEEFVERFPVIKVREPFHEYYERTKGLSEELKGEMKITKIAPVMELSIDELRSTIMFDNDFNELLERIKVDDLLGFSGDTFIGYDELSKSMYGTIFGRSTDKLLYNYDYGDDWNIEITRSRDLSDFISNQDYDLNWIHEAYNMVLDRHQPVCIGRKGKMVMDDVGGMGGYARFLDAIFCSEDQEEKESYLDWAKGMGWSNRKSAFKNML